MYAGVHGSTCIDNMYAGVDGKSLYFLLKNLCVCVCVCESRTSLKTILKKKIFHSKYFDSISNYVLSRSKICTDIVENPE